MTEIPEHLLKRSKERRAAMGLGEGEGDAAQPAEAGESTPAAAEKAPVAAQAATPAPVEAAPPPPKPDPPYVKAAKTRRRIPYWAMPVVALLPVWGVIYVNAVTEPPEQDDVIAHGADEYTFCASCHGAKGEGGAGVQLNAGEVLATFPDPKAMVQWIYLGGEAWTSIAGSSTYGDPDRPGGARSTDTLSASMPGSPDMSTDDLIAVTRYIREQLSGGPDESEIITPEMVDEAVTEADAGSLVYVDVDPDPERSALALEAIG